MRLLCPRATQDAKDGEARHVASRDFLSTRNTAAYFHYNLLRELAATGNACAMQSAALMTAVDLRAVFRFAPKLSASALSTLKGGTYRPLNLPFNNV
jgi:hypothetical protein